MAILMQAYEGLCEEELGVNPTPTLIKPAAKECSCMAFADGQIAAMMAPAPGSLFEVLKVVGSLSCSWGFRGILLGFQDGVDGCLFCTSTSSRENSVLFRILPSRLRTRY